MQTPREIELKLECEASDLTALACHPLLKVAEPTEPAFLDTTYYDTAERDLHAAKLSLRLRRENGRLIQTLKAASESAGLFDRPEWEWDVSGPVPDTNLLKDTPASAVLARASVPGLAPLFRTILERTTRPIRYGASEISVTLDAGRLETSKGDAPLCEVELELKHGTPADLFALAQALAESMPLRLGALSKGERGHALVAETLRKPSKAGPLTFDDDATAGEVFARIAQGCLRHLRLNEAVFRYDRNPEALHQMRVALRRLRSAFSLFKPMLEGDATALTLRDEIKRVTEPFGKARNLDVFLSETLSAEIERRPDEPGLHDLHGQLSADRERAYAAVIEILEGRAWRSLLLDLVAWIEAGPWRKAAAIAHRDRPAEDFAAAMLDRLRKRLKAHGKHLAKLSPEDRHRVRIEAKKLRYGAEFFGPLFAKKTARKRHKGFVAALAELQDHLGALNDLATAHEIAADLTEPRDASDAPVTGAALFAAGLTAADGETRTEALVDAAAEAHQDLLEVRKFWR